MRAAGLAASVAMGAAAACFSSQLTLLAAAQVEIGNQALPAPSAQVSASLEAVASLGQSLLDPAGYFQQLLAGLLSAQASVTADLALPGPPLLAQIAAAGSISASLDLGLSALTASISALSGIELAGSECVLALLAAEQALAAVLVRAQAAVNAGAALVAVAGTPGAQAFYYSGALSGAGAALDSVTPSSGVAGAADVRMVVSFVLSSDSPAVAAQAALMKVT